MLMVDLIEVVCFGGPQDGATLHVPSAPVFRFQELKFTTWELKTDIYALEATTEGHFRLRYLSSEREHLG